MPLLTPDPTFYPSPTMAMQSPPEKLAYLALINPQKDGRPTRLASSTSIPNSKSYGRLVGQTDMPHAGDELHHFGWNACSSCLCPYAPHPHMERRYLVVPGINSSRIHILDTKPDPRQPTIVKVIEPETRRHSAPAMPSPHTVHCGPDGVYRERAGRARRRTVPAARSCWIPKPSTSAAGGKSTAARSSWPTTCGGTSVWTRWSPAPGARRTW